MKLQPLVSICLNLAAIPLAWLATHGNVSATNLILFWVWMNAVTGFIFLALSEKNQTETAVKIKTPEWLSHLMDAAVIVTLVMAGWWASAIAYTFSMSVTATIYDRKRKATS